MNEHENISGVADAESETLLQAYQDALQSENAATVEAAMMKFFDFACAQAEKEPDQYLLWKIEAHRQEENGAWHEAEAAYRQALAFAEAQNNAAYIYKTQADLSRLHDFSGQKERALEAASAAVEAARRSDLKPLLSSALEGLASCLLRLDEAAQAFEVADELTQMLPEEKMYETQRGRALVLRARCHAALNRSDQARQDLDAAWPLLGFLADAPLFAGVQSGLANWWEVKAHLDFQQADFDGAADARRQAIAHRRCVAQAPQLEGPYKYASLALSLRSLGQALLAVEDIDGSEQAFRESRAIQKAIYQP